MNWPRVTSETVQCKNCGFVRKSNREYFVYGGACPGCKKRYRIVNDDSLYIPNYIPLKERIWHILGAIGLAIYTGWCIGEGAVIVPFGRGAHADAMVFNEWAMVPAAIAIVHLAAYALSHIADHYDIRNNEYTYKKFRRSCLVGIFVWLLFATVIQAEWVV